MSSVVHRMALWGTCPAVTHKQYKKLHFTVSLGEARVLQTPDSDASLSIPQGSPGVYSMTVHTDLLYSTSLIPQDECFISPVVQVDHILLHTDPGEKHCPGVYELTIPHSSKDKNLKKYIKVRHHTEGIEGNVAEEFRCPEESTGSPAHGTFAIHKKSVKVYTKSFSKFTCSSCRNNSCQADVLTLMFRGVSPFPSLQNTSVDFKLFLCCFLYKIKDFKQVGKFCFLCCYLFCCWDVFITCMTSVSYVILYSLELQQMSCNPQFCVYLVRS